MCPQQIGGTPVRSEVWQTEAGKTRPTDTTRRGQDDFAGGASASSTATPGPGGMPQRRRYARSNGNGLSHLAWDTASAAFSPSPGINHRAFCERWRFWSCGGFSVVTHLKRGWNADGLIPARPASASTPRGSGKWPFSHKTAAHEKALHGGPGGLRVSSKGVHCVYLSRCPGAGRPRLGRLTLLGASHPPRNRSTVSRSPTPTGHESCR